MSTNVETLTSQTSSVQTLEGLERKVVVTIPSTTIEEQVSDRLKKLAPKLTKVDGFRPGKVPLSVVKQRFSPSIREEVIREMIDPSIEKILQENNLRIASTPEINFDSFEPGKDLTFTAQFEVFPHVDVKDLTGKSVEIVSAEVTDKDVDALIEKLREENKNWVSVKRPVALHDKIRLDFKGMLDGKAFEGGEALDYELIVGSGKMIEAFESGLIGAKLNTPFTMDVTFPKDYPHKDLADKKTQFETTVKEIWEGELPSLDDEFAKKFNINEGGMEALKKDLKENMMRELTHRLGVINREKTFDEWLKVNSFELPKALVEQEIGHLKHDLFHRLYGQEHSEHEKIPDFPRELFIEQANRRVHLGILFAEYVKNNQFKVTQERVDKMIDALVSRYTDPDQMREYYKKNKDRRMEIEGLVMEEMVTEKLQEGAKIKNKSSDYQTVMQTNQTKNAKELESHDAE